MKKIMILATILLAGVVAHAKGDWKGTVLDENGEPLSYVNVVLLAQADSSVVSGVTTLDDGSFNIVTDRKDCLMMVAMIGYQTQYLSPAEGMVIRMVPDAAMLESAVTSAIMPKTKLTGEGLQTSVKGSVLENAGSAKDVLEKTPGIVKGQNGIEVIGKGSPLVYINGRKVTDQAELDRLQSYEIQSVEVINNPGAQYDASVQAVVRIRTVRRQGEGFSIDYTVKDSQSLRAVPENSPSNASMPFNDPATYLGINYRKNDVDYFGGANLYQFTHRQTSDIYGEILGNTPIIQDGHLVAEYMQQSTGMNAGMNWQMGNSHYAGFKLDYNQNFNVRNWQILEEQVTKNAVLEDDLAARNYGQIGDFKPYSFSANAYYNGTFGKTSIDWNVDYYTVGDSNKTHTMEESMVQDANLESSSTSAANMYASKLVLSHPVWMGMLQAGTEETFTRKKDNYTISGTDIPASQNTVKEDNIAGFASYAFYLPGVGQFSAGLRYEHVNYAYDNLLGSGSFTRKYDNFFPSFSWAGAVGKVQMMLNYSEKTMRPNFSMLDDAIRYNSRYVLQSGNSTLQPYTFRDGGYTAIWKYYVAGINYSRIDNSIASWSYKYNDEGVMMVKSKNMEEPYRAMSVYVNATPTIGIWSLNYTAVVQPQWFTITAPDPDNADATRTISFNGKPFIVLQMFNTLRFKHNWQMEFGGEYHSTGYSQNLLITNQYLDMSAAVQRFFLKDKSLMVRFEVKDLLGLATSNVATDYGTHIIRQTNVMDTQRAVLTVRYHFNAAQSKYRGTGAGSDTVSRMK